MIILPSNFLCCNFTLIIEINMIMIIIVNVKFAMLLVGDCEKNGLKSSKL